MFNYIGYECPDCGARGISYPPHRAGHMVCACGARCVRKREFASSQAAWKWVEELDRPKKVGDGFSMSNEPYEGLDLFTATAVEDFEQTQKWFEEAMNAPAG